MLVTVRTDNSQRKLKIDSLDQLENKIKEVFKTETFSLYLDLEKTVPIAVDQVKENTTVYMSYQMGEIKNYTEEFKCQHSKDATCPRCVNISRLEKTVSLPDQKVKYLSYESYLQALDAKSMKEEIFNYEKVKCDNHPPNQKCSRCMEKQITLVPQIFRHIDYVEFDNNTVVEGMIDSFKESGRQQIGLLIGKYAEYTEVPLGKKAIVSAVWNIEQEKYPDGVAVSEIPEKFFCKDLSIIGVIYTDLTIKDRKIKSSKAIGNYPISTSEIDFIASLRDLYEKKDFIGVCISTDKEDNIITECYMVTEQFMALYSVAALSLTTDPTKFLTHRDIAYVVDNEYNRKVMQKADPFLPIFYFVVKCEVGYKQNPIFLRQEIIKKDSVKKIAEYFSSDYSYEKFSNFSVLCALSKHIPSDIEELTSAIIKKDNTLFNNVIEKPNVKKFIEEMAQHNASEWPCSVCTYLNSSSSSICEMCETRKS